MQNTRTYGLNHIYFDDNSKDYSNVAVGLLLRAIGHGLKIAYVNCCGNSNKFTNFLENLSLSYSFTKRIDKFHMDIFTFKKDGKISRTFIPSVEFNTINEDMFYKMITDYDLVIYDLVSFDKISEYKINNILSSKKENTEVVMVSNSYGEFEKIKNKFDLVSVYKRTNNKLLGKKENIINITGNGKGKSTYSFGLIIRNFIDKQDVKLVYFDKGGNFYGERVFFSALKIWAKENNMYGKFDYVVTGCQRFDGTTFRFENTPSDIAEAKEGLMLLKTSLKMQTPVIAEELNTTIKTGLLKEEEVLDAIKNISNQLIITGRYSPKQIMANSNVLIEVIDEKHYASSGHLVRKGIDF